jgi:hypothetical protein
MSFAARLGPSIEFEERVKERLNSTGWPAFSFGQAQLPVECRQRLARFEDLSRRPCRIRWMPDIITFRDLRNGRSYVALIDAKASNGQRYAIEMSAVDTAEIYVDGLYTPTFFVFDDWNVLTPLEVRQRGFQGPFRGSGSGTPFLLVEKCYGRPFTDFFPPARELNT